MQRRVFTAGFSFLFPGGLLFMAALGFLRPQGLPVWCQGPITALPYVALIFGLLFGWYFASTRMLLSVVSLAFANQALATWPLEHDAVSVSRAVFAVSAFLLPVNFLAFSLVKEEKVGRLHQAMRLLLVLLQPFVVLWMCDPSEHDGVAMALQTGSIPGWSTHWTPIPQPALLVFLVCGVMHVIRFALRGHPMDAGATWALAASFLAFHGIQWGWQPTNYFSTAGLILFVSLVQSSYQQTYRDELTGIPGRIAYEEATAQLGKQFAIAVLEVDQLKTYAGTHGKPVVDQILALVAPKVEATCRAGRVFRVSGEELTLLFRQTALEALVELEHIRKGIESSTLVLHGGRQVREKRRHSASVSPKDQRLPITVSIGVADTSSEGSTLTVVLKEAYRALYEAKAGGGNVIKRGMITGEAGRRSYGRRPLTTGLSLGQPAWPARPFRPSR